MDNEKSPKNKLQEFDFVSLIDGWLKGDEWAREALYNFGLDEYWKFILALIKATDDKDMLAYIGAGILEDLLYGNSEEVIDRLENEAAINEKLRFCLAIVRNPTMFLEDPGRYKEIQQRIKNAVGSIKISEE